MKPRTLHETAYFCNECLIEVAIPANHQPHVMAMPLAAIPVEARIGGFDELDEDE